MPRDGIEPPTHGNDGNRCLPYRSVLEELPHTTSALGVRWVGILFYFILDRCEKKSNTDCPVPFVISLNILLADQVSLILSKKNEKISKKIKEIYCMKPKARYNVP